MSGAACRTDTRSQVAELDHLRFDLFACPTPPDTLFLPEERYWHMVDLMLVSDHPWWSVGDLKRLPMLGRMLWRGMGIEVER